MTALHDYRRESTLDRVAGVLCAFFAVVGLLMVLSALTGCAKGIDLVEQSLPKAANGIHVAAQVDNAVLHELAMDAASKCRSNGVTDPQKCPGWLRVDSVRVAVEEVVRAFEDDLVGLKSKIEAYRKVREAIARLKGGQ